MKKKSTISLIIISILGLSIFGILWYKNVKLENTIAQIDNAKSSFEKLIQDSPVIIQGHVKSIGANKWNTLDGEEPKKISENDIVYSDAIVEVDKVFKGNVSDGKTIIVRVYKGENKKLFGESKDDKKPRLSENENVVLFLINDKSIYNILNSNDYYVINGLAKGKFTLINGYAKSIFYSLSEQEFYKAIQNNKTSP